MSAALRRLVDFYPMQARLLWEWQGGPVALVKQLIITVAVATASFAITAFLVPLRTCDDRAVSSNTLPTTVFILLGLVLIMPLVAWMNRRADIGRWSSLVRLVFAAYLVVLVGLLFTPFPFPPWTRLPEESLIGYRPWPFPWVNIAPFETISGALRYGLDWQPGRVLVGNVLAFAPFGVFLPIIWPRWRSLISVVAAGLAISLALEAVQLGLSLLIGAPYRVADVDDVIINVLGVALAYGLYRAIGLFLPADPTVQPVQPAS